MKTRAKKSQTVTIAILALLIGSSACFAQDTESKTVRDVPREGFYSAAHQFVFFAVLEGCFIDGLNREDIEKILPGKKGWQNFVISCPICEPAHDGFRMYAERMTLSKQISKHTDSSYNTFGQGLDEKIREQLSKAGQPCRDAIKALIQKWVDARIETFRLDENETKELRDELARMRKEGEKALKGFKSGKPGDWTNYKGWEEGCPICKGASPVWAE
jgi:hypothetical protein